MLDFYWDCLVELNKDLRQDLREKKRSSTSWGHLSLHTDWLETRNFVKRREISHICSYMLFIPTKNERAFSQYCQKHFYLPELTWLKCSLVHIPLCVCSFFHSFIFSNCFFLLRVNVDLDSETVGFSKAYTLYGTPDHHREPCQHTHRHTYTFIFQEDPGIMCKTPHNLLHAVPLCHPNSFMWQFILSFLILTKTPFKNMSKN